ncbi:alpha/beta hydrolase family protein [Nonomuraea sp. NPDC059023]|uniref:alpha/beta hydrolase family protein n=1 Tax=unclassified Nonomuraea TaxID=2593643 RepID=UPI0036C26B1D
MRTIMAVLLLAALLTAPARPAAATTGRTLLESRPLAVPAELAAAGATGFRIRYLSTSPKGRRIEVTGAVFLPSGTAPPGGRRVISWAHGTTGVSDRCSPSRDRELGGYGYPGYLAGFVRRGYAVAATDYEGLGTPGVHPYLIAESQARSVVDAVRAAGDLSPDVSRVWLTVGHSQGGHAAMAAGEIAAGYGRGLDFRGTVALAPVTDNRPYVDQLSRLQPVDHGYYMAMLAGLSTRHPGLRLADYLGPRARREYPRVHTTCMTELTNRLTKLNLPGTEFTPATGAATAKLRGWLGENAVPRTRSAAPMLVAQGLTDVLVSPAQTAKAAERARALGTATKLITYPGTDHFRIITSSAPDVLRWIDTRLRR